MSNELQGPFVLIVAPDPITGDMKELHISGDGRFVDLVTSYWRKAECVAWWRGQAHDGVSWDLANKVQAAIGWMHECPFGGALSFVAWVSEDGVFHVVPVAGKVVVHDTPPDLWYPSGTYGPWPVAIGRLYSDSET